jgi:hypothetical protein
MLNSRYIAVRYGHSVNTAAPMSAAARSPVIRSATAYMAQPESAQKRRSATL